MEKQVVMEPNEILLWLSIIIIGSLSNLYSLKYSTLLVSWVVILLFVGNAKRFYSSKHEAVTFIIRRSFYVVPFLIPMLIGFRAYILAENIFIWCLAGVIMGIGFIIPKLNEWRITLSKDMIQFTRKKSKIDYATNILMLLGAAIGEEIFYRNFVIGYMDNTPYAVSILLSTFLFFLNHFGVKWNKGFKLYDYAVQILFGAISAILFILSKSVLPSIIAHVIYNSPLIIFSIKGYAFHHLNNSMGRESCG